ncbi:MAG: hypothetical protein QMC27_08085 [Flavobacteriaceae bacterium]|jgi:hypothetical protein|tara:strand:+ start:562 stop:939 length:378 start_codon:yes stop_codon:yes gene_type:complete
MKKKILLFVFTLCLFFLGYNYLFPDHRTINQEEALFNVEASILFDEFIDNSKQAEYKYLNQTITVSGVITSFNTENIMINNKIFCKFDNIVNKININDSIVVKGRCIGYDELLEEIKLDQCSIVK